MAQAPGHAILCTFQVHLDNGPEARLLRYGVRRCASAAGYGSRALKCLFRISNEVCVRLRPIMRLDDLPLPDLSCLQGSRAARRACKHTRFPADKRRFPLRNKLDLVVRMPAFRCLARFTLRPISWYANLSTPGKQSCSLSSP